MKSVEDLINQYLQVRERSNDKDQDELERTKKLTISHKNSTQILPKIIYKQTICI